MFRYIPDGIDVPQPIEDVNGEPDLTKLDLAAEWFYRNGNVPRSMGYIPGQGQVNIMGEVWFICVRVQRTGQDPEWIIYAYASNEDPAWGGGAPSYDVPGPSAEQIARGLAGEGCTVFLRKYSGFSTTYAKTGQTITF